MPPRGVKKGSKRARQYEHIKDSLEERGVPRAEEIAARTVNKERARSGEAAGVVAALARGHLVRPSRRHPREPQGTARPDQGAALRGGQGPRREGPLEDDEGPAPARGLTQARVTRTREPARSPRLPPRARLGTVSDVLWPAGGGHRRDGRLERVGGRPTSCPRRCDDPCRPDRYEPIRAAVERRGRVLPAAGTHAPARPRDARKV